MSDNYTYNDVINDTASVYEAARHYRGSNPYDRTPGWSYYDMMTEGYGVKDPLNPKYYPIARHTVMSDPRPTILGDKLPTSIKQYNKGNWFTNLLGVSHKPQFLTPSSRAYARRLYNDAPGSKNKLHLSEMLPGERSYIRKGHRLQQAYNELPFLSPLLYKMGLIDPNTYMQGMTINDWRYTPDPAHQGLKLTDKAMQDNSARAKDAFVGGMLPGVATMFAIDKPLRDTLGVSWKAGKGIYRAARANTLSHAGKKLTQPFRVAPRSTGGIVRGIAPRLGGTALSAALTLPFAFAGGANEAANMLESSIATGTAKPDWDEYLYELPILGYERGPNGPQPVRAGYNDYYNHLYRTRSPQHAQNFRRYQLNKAHNSNVSRYNDVKKAYSDEWKRINESGFHPQYRDKMLLELNQQYEKKLNDLQQAVATSSNALSAFNKNKDKVK